MSTQPSDVLDLLDSLVRIEAVNPLLDPAGSGETGIATFVAEWGRQSGLSAETVERRTLPGETLEQIEADVAGVLERARPRDDRITVTSRTLAFREGMKTPEDAVIVQKMLTAAGEGSELVPLSYWADSALLSTAGIPTVLYGPEGEGAHADVEWVSLSGTVTAAEVLTRLALDFCGQPPGRASRYVTSAGS